LNSIPISTILRKSNINIYNIIYNPETAIKKDANTPVMPLTTHHTGINRFMVHSSQLFLPITINAIGYTTHAKKTHTPIPTTLAKISVKHYNL